MVTPFASDNGLAASLSGRIAQQWHELEARLASIAERHPDAVFATSLGAEDMVLTHAIFSANLPITIFTLDTGRLHTQTLDTIGAVNRHYGREIVMFYPDASAVSAHVTEYGAFAFYESIELRKACCGIRKVEPLRRALAGRSAWLTGQRREQAATRGSLPEEEQDPVFGLYKFNPLAQWSQTDVWDVIEGLSVPYNPLHDEGYPSIGCEPCTRAVREGEDVRAGRWWWESADAKECGLHSGNSAGGTNKIVPIRSVGR